MAEKIKAKRKMLPIAEELHYQLKVRALEERLDLTELATIALQNYLIKKDYETTKSKNTSR